MSRKEKGEKGEDKTKKKGKRRKMDKHLIKRRNWDKKKRSRCKNQERKK